MKYCLVGVDGNAFSVMGYTAGALREQGLGDKVKEMQADAMSGDYNHLLAVCCEYIDMANAEVSAKGEDTDDDDDWFSDDEEEDDYDDDWGYNEDMGFDPYEGCYTDDV